jgi:hypothetical protein
VERDGKPEKHFAAKARKKNAPRNGGWQTERPLHGWAENRFASDAVSGRFMFGLAGEMGSFGVARGVGAIGGEWLFGRGAFGLHNGVTFRFEL